MEARVSDSQFLYQNLLLTSESQTLRKLLVILKYSSSIKKPESNVPLSSTVPEKEMEPTRSTSLKYLQLIQDLKNIYIAFEM